MTKIRTDFITNSSSSSFVIAYRNTLDVDQETLKKYPWIASCASLLELVLMQTNDYPETSEGTICRNIKDLNKMFIENYGYGFDDFEIISGVLKCDNEELNELYKKMCDCVNNGMNIIFKEVDYSDDTFVSMLADISKDKNNVIVLDRE